MRIKTYVSSLSSRRRSWQPPTCRYLNEAMERSKAFGCGGPRPDHPLPSVGRHEPPTTFPMHRPGVGSIRPMTDMVVRRSSNEDPNRRHAPDAEGDGDHRTVVTGELGASSSTRQGEWCLL